MEMRGMSGELLGTIGPGNPLENQRSIDKKLQTSSIAGPCSPPSAPPRPPLPRPPPPAFIAKKRKILAALHPPGRGDYSDKSPKGSVDAQIADLIDEINAYDGLVTTSSCAGRVSVFLEGEKARAPSTVVKDVATDDEREPPDELDQETDRAVPGGKGLGGRWLFVSHEPLSTAVGAGVWSETFNLIPQDLAQSMSLPISISQPSFPVPRLVKFAFEPLILHVLCGSLRHAQPLLAAAVNAGFRESGVQSLKILDEKEREGAGVMVGIRTAGLGLESVVGIWDGSGEGEGEGEEHARAVVSEEYLDLLVRVAEERFKANEERRERFRRELREHMERFEQLGNGDSVWEDKDVRARRKRQEGLQRQRLLLIETEDGGQT